MNFSKLGKAIQFSKIGITTLTLSKFNKVASQQYLIKEIGKLPGIPAKMGQILLMKYEQSPSENTSPDPFPLEWVKHHILTESPNLASKIESIDETAMTASLGQVHRALLKNNEEVAIKIRYPGIESEIQEQLEIMMSVLNNAPAPSAIKVDTQEYGIFLKDFFKEEINYQKEAQSQNKFREAWKSDPRFLIPEVIFDDTTSSLLVQRFEPSINLSSCLDLTKNEKEFFYQSMKDFFINGLFNFGLVHTDLHEKNWGFRRETRQLVIYDFGATIQLSEELKRSLIYLSMMNHAEPVEYLNAFESLGFERKKMQEIQDQLPELCEILFEPLRLKDNWNPNHWNLQKRVNDLLNHKKWNFRTAGPPWFLLFIRGLNGWIHALKVLSSSTEPKTKLYIRITESNREKASLEFPATSVELLEDLMPDTALVMIRKNGIPLNDLIQKAINSQYTPQILFETNSNNKNYKVWIG